jgi:hypothetical protein
MSNIESVEKGHGTWRKYKNFLIQHFRQSNSGCLKVKAALRLCRLNCQTKLHVFYSLYSFFIEFFFTGNYEATVHNQEVRKKCWTPQKCNWDSAIMSNLSAKEAENFQQEDDIFYDTWVWLPTVKASTT